MRLSCVELASMTAPMNVPIAPRIPVASPNQIIPLVPVGNRRVRGAVHVEFHRFRPTVAAMTGVMNRCEIPPAPSCPKTQTNSRPARVLRKKSIQH